MCTGEDRWSRAPRIHPSRSRPMSVVPMVLIWIVLSLSQLRVRHKIQLHDTGWTHKDKVK